MANVAGEKLVALALHTVRSMSVVNEEIEGLENYFANYKPDPVLITPSNWFI